MPPTSSQSAAIRSGVAPAAVVGKGAVGSKSGSGGKNSGGGSYGLVSLLAAQVLTVDNARTLIFYIVVYRYTLKLWRHIRAYGVTTSLYQLYHALSKRLLTLLLKIPAARRKVARELDAATVELETKLLPQSEHIGTNWALPTLGRDVNWLREELRKLQMLEVGAASATSSASSASASSSAAMVKSGSTEGSGWQQRDGQRVWQGGKISGAVYHGGQEMSDILGEAVRMFLVSNPLHPDVFPGVRKMEAEVVSMVLRLYNAPDDAAGTTTSGGTESILMACKTAREWGRATKGITEPEMIVSTSAHAAFDKAGAYFGIRVIHIDPDAITRKVKVESMRRAMNPNTVLLVGSAPSFGEGIIDDIPAIAGLAKRRNVLCHVDCCLGSFLVPYLERAGLASEPFDFRVDGVTSISCDTHKYGFAPKGSSIVMYRSNALRRHQYYIQPDWPGGVYASPSMAGSRPGALIAGTWAAMMRMGDEGYTQSCREIVGAARRIERAVRDEIPELRIMGRPLVSVVAFSSAGRVNIYEVGDKMSGKGWHLNGLATEPPGIHLACTRLTVPVVDDFVRDLKASVKEARVRDSGKKQGSMAMLYGLGSSSAVGPSLVKEMAARFLDTLYLVK